MIPNETGGDGQLAEVTPGRNPVVLVVDDQVGVRLLLEEVFRPTSCLVLLAAHGQEALALAQTTAPDIALVDVKMPVMDGIETLRALRSRHPQLPVLMMTAVEDSHRLEECLSLGASRIITKPFDVFQVRALAEQLLASRR